MSVVDLHTRQPIDLDAETARRILHAQGDEAVMEADLARSRELLAEALVRNDLKSYRFTIGDVLHPTLGENRCPLCEGRFAKRGECFAVRMPESLGGAWKAMHVQCFLGASQWTT